MPETAQELTNAQQNEQQTGAQTPTAFHQTSVGRDPLVKIGDANIPFVFEDARQQVELYSRNATVGVDSGTLSFMHFKHAPDSQPKPMKFNINQSTDYVHLSRGENGITFVDIVEKPKVGEVDRVVTRIRVDKDGVAISEGEHKKEYLDSNLGGSFKKASETYKDATTRDLKSDLNNYGDERQVPDARSVKNAVGEILGLPAGTEMSIDYSDLTNSALNNNSIRGSYVENGERRSFYIDFHGDQLFKAGKKISLAKDQSSASAPHGISFVMEDLANELGGNGKWSYPNNPTAKEYEANAERYEREKPEASKYIKRKASGDVAVVNNFLEDNDFEIRLRDAGPGACYAASVVDVGVKWRVPGRKIDLTIDETKTSVPGVHIKEPAGFYTATGHQHSIVELETQSGERFFMTKYEGDVDPNNPVEVERIARELSMNKERTDLAYPGGVKFPMADYQRDGEAAWLKGAIYEGTGAIPEPKITQALFEHRFRMNELGARGEASFAAGVGRGLTPRSLDIKGEYIVWFEAANSPRSSAVIPFAAYITEKDMKDPKTLD